jgi:hypothetical protein
MGQWGACFNFRYRRPNFSQYIGTLHAVHMHPLMYAYMCDDKLCGATTAVICDVCVLVITVT